MGDQPGLHPAFPADPGKPAAWSVRLAAPVDAAEIAQLLHDFNLEFGAATPGPTVVEQRLATLLGSPSTFALIATEEAEKAHQQRPAALGLALVTLRTNVWYDGQVALLDELYVRPSLRSSGIGSAIMSELAAMSTDRHIACFEINVDEGDVDALRFYARHGFSEVEPDTGERAFYLFREVAAPPNDDLPQGPEPESRPETPRS